MTHYTIHFVSYDLTPSIDCLENHTDFTYEVDAQDRLEAIGLAKKFLDQTAYYYGLCKITEVSDGSTKPKRIFEY